MRSYDDDSDSTVSRLMKRIERRIVGDVSRGDETIRLGTVAVPSPGVPEDIPVDIDSEILSLSCCDDGEGRD